MTSFPNISWTCTGDQRGWVRTKLCDIQTLVESMTSILPRTRRWNVDEYYRMSELGVLHPEERTELIEGEITITAAKNPPHAAVGKFAADYLRNLLAGIADIRTQDPVYLSNSSEPEPDIAVVRINTRNYIDHHPISSEIFLVIEVADATLEYDLKRKAEIYAMASIIEYWVIDVNEQQIHVFQEPGEKIYQQKRILTVDDKVALLAFPEINVSIKNFFLNSFSCCRCT